MKLLLDKLSGNFQLVGGHQSPELAVLLVAGDLLLGAILTNLEKVERLQLIALFHFNVSSDLGAVGSIVTVQGDLAASDSMTVMSW